MLVTTYAMVSSRRYAVLEARAAATELKTTRLNEQIHTLERTLHLAAQESQAAESRIGSCETARWDECERHTKLVALLEDQSSAAQKKISDLSERVRKEACAEGVLGLCAPNVKPSAQKYQHASKLRRARVTRCACRTTKERAEVTGSHPLQVHILEEQLHRRESECSRLRTGLEVAEGLTISFMQRLHEVGDSLTQVAQSERSYKEALQGVKEEHGQLNMQLKVTERSAPEQGERGGKQASGHEAWRSFFWGP